MTKGAIVAMKNIAMLYVYNFPVVEWSIMVKG